MSKALFEGLILDENEHPVSVTYVGDEPTYVVVEDGFKYHVDARTVDDQVMQIFIEQMKSNSSEVSQGILKMMGKDDLFTKASVDNQIRNFDKNLDQLYAVGIPEQSRAYLGMMGFKVIINRRGEIVNLSLPSVPDDEAG
jgi:hypothetical protein